MGRDRGWELRNIFDVGHVSQSMKRYQVLVVELELPLHTGMISEHIKKIQADISCHFQRYQDLYKMRTDN